MNISQAASQTGLSSKTIRFYEQQGIIRPAARAENGYRTYNAAQIAQLRFIKRARDLGFSLQESHELLQLAEDPQRRSADVKRKFLEKLAALEAEIDQLQQKRALMLGTVDRCPGDEGARCPIIDQLTAGESAS
ncbi:Cu(I)-responsive transcriptional regulator [Marinobacterium arenosum]|uniref:Cu(I)-responsive transcriptional regulator n=1 Tax=Marinobacterium arenosum TaxID=2862496 RepID=UPI001C981AF5|nr:Cu(I)-responsive transcriptional regulator [Marinobacterium arenosum]MBY4677589.1 Cu(I)-responsive transcriptional regulator [Marinobacterium arenosum]